MARELPKQFQILREFQDAAGCHRTQHKAYKAYQKLREYLTEEERYDIRDGWLHTISDVSTDPPRDMVDAECEKIREHWMDRLEQTGYFE